MMTELKVLDLREQLKGAGGFCQTGCDPGGKCGNGLEKIYPTCAVRYGYMRYIGEFRYAPNMKFACGGKVVVQTNRGMEIGEQVSLTCSGCEKSISRKQIQDYVRASGNEFFELKAGKILRAATKQDLDEQAHLNQDAARKLMRAKEIAAGLGLNMKFILCEHLLGGERLIFHFMSEDRVDFRELVKQLAHEYHTRIEMHQVGARDEARLVADYEICGRECCCKNFLKKLRPVNMKMAKLQKATLDPSKVSGRCGRLRCCLRYEHEGYEELNKKLPRTGARIRTERGIGTVIDRQILTQLLSVQYDDSNELETVAVESVLERGLPPRPPMPPPMERDSAGPGRNDRDRRREAARPRPDRRPFDGDTGGQPDRPRAEAGDRAAGPLPLRPVEGRSGAGSDEDFAVEPESAGSAEPLQNDVEPADRLNDAVSENGFATGIDFESEASPDEEPAGPASEGAEGSPQRRRRRRRRGRGRRGPRGEEGGSPGPGAEPLPPG